jgi:hypothetical protein
MPTPAWPTAPGALTGARGGASPAGAPASARASPGGGGFSRSVPYSPRASLAASTLARHLAAIAAAHAAAVCRRPPTPTSTGCGPGIKRTHGRPPRKKRALVVEDLRRVIAKLPTTRHGIRDRALLLVGFAGALRRSELAALTLGPCEPAMSGPSSSRRPGDPPRPGQGRPEGQGAIVAIPYGRKLCRWPRCRPGSRPRDRRRPGLPRDRPARPYVGRGDQRQDGRQRREGRA